MYAGVSTTIAQEPLHDLRASEHLGKQELHCHRLTEVEVSHLHHDGHSTRADDPLDTISAGENGTELDVAAIHHRITRQANTRGKESSQPHVAFTIAVNNVDQGEDWTPILPARR